jgi:hypothetical protein
METEIRDARGIACTAPCFVSGRFRVRAAVPARNDEVVARGPARVRELEALVPPRAQDALEIGMDRHLALVFPRFRVVRLERRIVVLGGDDETRHRRRGVVQVALPPSADLTLAHARIERERREYTLGRGDMLARKGAHVFQRIGRDARRYALDGEAFLGAARTAPPR